MTDPAVRAGEALTNCVEAYRDLLTDDGYRAVLPALEQLADALPEPVVVPMPRRRPTETHPMDGEVR